MGHRVVDDACEELREISSPLDADHVEVVCGEIDDMHGFLVDMIGFLDDNGHSNTKIRYKVDLLLNHGHGIAGMRERVAELEKTPGHSAWRD